MGRLLKLLLYLIVLGALGLIAYSYLGDMSSPNVDIVQPVVPDAS
ncbi:MAG: hypothetical protein QM492_10540 [Rhodobacterales bacterium]